MLVGAFLLPLVYLVKLLLNLTFSLDCFSLDMARQFSDFEERYSQSQTELAQVSAALNDANMLNSTLRAQLDSEKVIYESAPCVAVFLLLA
jgi:hypothetical protein